MLSNFRFGGLPEEHDLVQHHGMKLLAGAYDVSRRESETLLVPNVSGGLFWPTHEAAVPLLHMEVSVSVEIESLQNESSSHCESFSSSSEQICPVSNIENLLLTAVTNPIVTVSSTNEVFSHQESRIPAEPQPVGEPLSHVQTPLPT